MAFSFVLRALLEAPGNSRTSEYSTACALYFSRRSVVVRTHRPDAEPRAGNLDLNGWIDLLLARILLDQLDSLYLSITVDIFIKPTGSPAQPLSRRCALAPPVPPSLLPRL